MDERPTLPIDYASPAIGRRPSPWWSARPRFAEIALGVVQAGLSLIALSNGWLPTAPGDGGPILVRLGRTLVDGRLLVAEYGVALALSIAAALAATDRRRRAGARCILWWLATLLALLGGIALTTDWPGEHRLRWVAAHNMAVHGSFWPEAA